MKFIDSHCHLNFKAFNDDRKKTITSAKKAGIEKIIVPGADLYSSQNALMLAKEYKNYCFAAVGIHPHHAIKVINLQEDINRLEQLVIKPYVIAIGEVGLDYHLYKGQQAVSRKDLQQELLEEQIRLADKYNLPLVLHCRDAFDDLLNLLEQYQAVLTKVGGVIHCFSGGLAHLRRALRMNLYIGFDGNTTYDRRLQDVIAKTPLIRILLETDSPYLTPEPLRGSRNVPKNVRLVGKAVAKIKNLTLGEIARVTVNNANKLFRLSSVRI